MPDFNPNEMDALFREGAERHEFEYNPDAWALMEEKLDRRDRRRRVVFFILGLLLLLIPITLFTLKKNGQQVEKEQIASFESVENEKVENETINIEDVKTENLETTDASTEKNTNEYISGDSKESSSNIGAQNSFQSESTGNLVGSEIVSAPSREEDDIDYARVEIVENNALTDVVSTEEDVDETVVNQTRSEEKRVNHLKSSELQLFERSPLRFENIILEITPSNDVFIAPAFASNRFAVTLFANPEWSSVGLFEESKLGWSLGSRLGFQFADKFEFSAGVAYSRKIFKGSGGEYTMEGGWIYDIEPMQMDSKCDVIEVPVGLSYYINGFRNDGFFVDAGISSYMLHSEWYGFDYNDALLRPKEYVDVTKEGENKHLVGVGRFSIGYQKVLSDHTSIQVAPYLQFPLTGIGAGLVNVYSSGVQLAVKFNTQ